AEVQDASLRDTEFAQPALFTTCYALARSLMSWGIKPDSMIGHSVGEYVAACLSGVMELEDAVSLVSIRGKLMAKVQHGAMLALPLGEHEAARSLRDFGRLSVAAVNGPQLTVVSGPTETIDQFERSLSSAGTNSKRLQVSHAFHSEMMIPILDEFTRAVHRIQLRPPTIPYISNVTGTWISRDQATSPEYYSRQLREMVRFHAGIQELLEEPDRVLLEVGPPGPLKASAGAPHTRDRVVIRTLRRPGPDQEGGGIAVASKRGPAPKQANANVVAETIASLWVNGVVVDWDRVHEGELRNLVPLPSYPFERQRYWIEASGFAEQKAQNRTEERADFSKWFYGQVWKRAPLPNKSHGQSPDSGGDEPRLLIIGESAPLIERIAQLCESAAIGCSIAGVDGQFEKIDDRRYSIDAAEKDSYLGLFNDLRKNGRW
ncbi:MAG: acyltransferase domain-containing protein, partial [Blastocatellia bacterium]